MPEDPAAQEALMKAAKENPALARSFAARGTATMVLMRAKTPLTSSDNSQLQSEHKTSALSTRAPCTGTSWMKNPIRKLLVQKHMPC